MIKKVIRVPSADAYLEQVVEETQAFVESHFSDEDFAYRVVLSTTEAVTNAMKHGNKYDQSKSVTIELSVDHNRVDVMVEDEGPGFNRKTVKNPLEKENLMRSFGRGIYLMEKMADEMRYELGGRRVYLSFIQPDS